MLLGQIDVVLDRLRSIIKVPVRKTNGLRGVLRANASACGNFNRRPKITRHNEPVFQSRRV